MTASNYRWAKVLQMLEEHFPPAVVDELFRDVELIRLDEQALVLFTADLSHEEAICKRVVRPLREILKRLYGIAPEISFLDSWQPAVLATPAPKPRDTLLPDYTLENFRPGTNHIALALAQQAAERPGDMRHNPLVFYGPSGTGKTHLLHAIGNRIRRDHPQMRVDYLRCSDFTADMVNSILDSRANMFRRKYLHNDLLLMDDIQCLSGASATQEEFYNLFNRLYERGCQIVLACDRPLDQLLALEDRMAACFIGGIMQPLTLPDRQARLDYLQEYAPLHQVELSREALELIATRITGGFPQLQGVVSYLWLDASEHPCTPDLPTVSKAIEELCPSLPK